MTTIDELDQLAAAHFDGYLVKKDLAQQFKGQYPVPTYVGEFLLGKYCATTDPDEIAEGLEIVQRNMAQRTVRAGEQELFKMRAQQDGRVKIIDLIRAKLNAAENRYEAELPSLQLNTIHIADNLVVENDRMLTGGFFAEVTLEYITALASEKGGMPFRVESIRPIQMSSSNALQKYRAARAAFTLDQWRELLLRSVGFEPAQLNRREQDMLILRMVPFAVNNYNAVEIGPRGTGKSHLFQQVSPYAHLVSGGKATIANMFVNNRTGQRGLVAQYDVICFDEVSGVSFDQKEGVNMLKGYMESGEFSRGKESIKAEGGIVMVGNFDVDVHEQLRTGHLLGPLPKEMRDDTAFMDRIHAYVPGWDVPKLNPTYFTTHFGFVSDFLAECWAQLRRTSRLEAIQGRLEWNTAVSGRDRTAVNKTVDGLLRLLYPDPDTPVPDEFLVWAAELALEVRRRVKEAQAYIGEKEFGAVDLGYSLDGGSETIVYCDETVQHRRRVDSELSPQPGTNTVTVGPEDTTPSTESYTVGEVIDGRYEVLSLLGEGGFSKVYKVLDTVEGVEYAFKMFTTKQAYDAVRREITALRKVQHPNVVKVVWADQTAAGTWFLVMEYIKGDSLTQFVRGGEQLRIDEVVQIGDQLLSALVKIHPDPGTTMPPAGSPNNDEGEGLVHRDIKPENIILTRTGVKLLDFNIASRAGAKVGTLSHTPAYLAPDVDYDMRWDVSADLFATGVVLYELLCQAHPYERSDPRLGEGPIAPADRFVDLPPKLNAFLMKACARSRNDRYSHAEEMRDALRDALTRS